MINENSFLIQTIPVGLCHMPLRQCVHHYDHAVSCIRALLAPSVAVADRRQSHRVLMTVFHPSCALLHATHNEICVWIVRLQCQGLIVCITGITSLHCYYAACCIPHDFCRPLLTKVEKKRKRSQRQTVCRFSRRWYFFFFPPSIYPLRFLHNKHIEKKKTTIIQINSHRYR